MQSCCGRPGVTLCDGMVYEYAEGNRLISPEHDFERDILACVANISKRYMGSKKRSESVENIALTIFDSMKKIHGLGKESVCYCRSLQSCMTAENISV